MKTESELKAILESHENNTLDSRTLASLKIHFPGKSADYWRGYHDGVTFGYKTSLK